MVSSPTIPVVLFQSRFRRWRDRDLDILVEVDPNPSTFPDYYVPPISLEQRTYVHDSHHDSHAAANRSSDSGALQPVGDGSHGGSQNGEPERSGDHDCFPTTVREAQTVLFDPPVERNRAAVRKNNMVEDQLQAGRDLFLLVCRAGGCDGAVQPCPLRESKFSIDGQRAKDVCFHSVALARRLAADGFVQASEECFSGQKGLRLGQGETARERAQCKNDACRRNRSDSKRSRSGWLIRANPRKDLGQAYGATSTRPLRVTPVAA